MKTMRYILLILFCLFLTHKASAQMGVTVNFNHSHPGNSLNIGVLNKINNNTIHIGLKYHLNKNTDDLNVTTLYQNNYYSSSTIDHFGINLGYNYDLNIFDKAVYPYLFYNFNLIHSSLFKPGLIDEFESEDLFDPVWTFDNYLGVGIKYDITNSLILQASAGIGVSTCINPPDEVLGNNYVTEVAHMFSFGLNYFFSNKQ